MQVKIVQATLIIIFWQSTFFQYAFDSMQVKRELISSITYFVYELPYELSNDLRFRILEN